MHIAFASVESAVNVRSWSGIPYFMTQTLKTEGEQIDVVGPLSTPRRWLYRARKAAWNIATGKCYLWDREPAVLRAYADQVRRRLADIGPDVLLSSGSQPISALDCKQPIVMWTDATFAGIVGFYPEFSNLTTDSVENGNRMEQAALDRCSLAIFSSEWAVRAAVEHYDVDPQRVKFVNFGANLTDAPTEEEVEAFIAARRPGPLRFLLLGVNWRRKGGDTAVAVVRALRDRGVPAELSIVGCVPPLEVSRANPWLTVIPFIDKSDPEQRAHLRRMLAGSHFLILPVLADCSPIVLCEANAFGVPCLTNDVGGVPSIIAEGVNGFVMPPPYEADAYVRAVLGTQERWEDYRDLARRSYREYATRLNWPASVRKVKNLIREIR